MLGMEFGAHSVSAAGPVHSVRQRHCEYSHGDIAMVILTMSASLVRGPHEFILRFCLCSSELPHLCFRVPLFLPHLPHWRRNRFHLYIGTGRVERMQPGAILVHNPAIAEHNTSAL